MSIGTRTLAVLLFQAAVMCSPSSVLAADDEFAGGFISANTYRGFAQEFRNGLFGLQYNVQEAAFAAGYAAGVHDYSAANQRLCSSDEASINEIVIAAFEQITLERGGRAVSATWNGNRQYRSAVEVAADPIESALSGASPCDDDTQSGRVFVPITSYLESHSHFERFLAGNSYDEYEATFALAYAVGVYDIVTNRGRVCAPTSVQMLAIPQHALRHMSSAQASDGAHSTAELIGAALENTFPCPATQ